MTKDMGYLQHGKGTSGPFRTQSVVIRQRSWPNAHSYEAHYEGRWRVVHVQMKRNYIIYRGMKIDIKIWGV